MSRSGWSVPTSALVTAVVLVVIDRVFFAAHARYDENPTAYAPLVSLCLSLWSEGLPLWNPYIHFGQPLLPDLASGPLYPPGLLVAALSPERDVSQWWVVLHAALAASGAAFLARSLARSDPAALLAGVSFGLGAPTLYVAKYWMIMGLGPAWTPWTVAFLLGARRGSWRDAGVAAFALALQLHAGSIEGVVEAGLLGLVVVALVPREEARAWAPVVAAVVLSVLLSLPVLVEVLNALALSHRTTESLVGGAELSPRSLLGLAWPVIPAAFRPETERLSFATGLFQGFIPHLLILVCFRWRSADRVERALAITGVIALLLALGSTMGSDLAWDRLPLLRHCHHPVGRLHLVGLAVALVSAYALDRSEGVRPMSLVTPGLLLIGLGVGSVLVLSALSQVVALAVASKSAAGWCLGLGAAVALGAVAPPRFRRVSAPLATIVLLVLQLALLWESLWPWRMRPVQEEPVPPVVQVARDSHARIAPVLRLFEGVEVTPFLGRNAGLVLRFPSTLGYTGFLPARVADLYGIDRYCGTDEQRFSRLARGSALEAAGIRFVHGSHRLADLVPPGSRLVEWSRNARVVTFENRAWAGRAYRVARAEGSAVTKADFERPDLLDVALVASSSTVAGRTFERGPVLAFRERGRGIDVDLAPVPARSLLVVTTSWNRGWGATVDGEESAVHLAQGHLMAVEVPAGGTAVRLRYMGRPLAVALILALAAALVSIVLVIFGRRPSS